MVLCVAAIAGCSAVERESRFKCCCEQKPCADAIDTMWNDVRKLSNNVDNLDRRVQEIETLDGQMSARLVEVDRYLVTVRRQNVKHGEQLASLRALVPVTLRQFVSLSTGLAELKKRLDDLEEFGPVPLPPEPPCVEPEIVEPIPETTVSPVGPLEQPAPPAPEKPAKQQRHRRCHRLLLRHRGN